jgi:membrane protease YdiL (CAAX protease family)
VTRSKRLRIAAEPFCLFALLATLNWWLYGVAQRVPWLWKHYEDANTALFLYLPLIPMLLAEPPADEADSRILARYGLTFRGAGRGLAILCVTALATFIPFLLCWRFASLHGPSWFRPEFDPHVPKGFREVMQFQLLYVALPEEIFFRAYMQTRLDQVFTGRCRILGAALGWSWPLTAGLFALAHPLLSTPISMLLAGHGWINLDTFFPGLLFGWLRARTGSVLAPILMHWMCNLVLFSCVGR